MNDDTKSKGPSGPTKTEDFPVTLGMLYGVRDDLRSHISGVEHSLKAEMGSLKQEVRSDFHLLRAEIKSMDSRIHQMHILAEEQNQRNKLVMDQMISLFNRQDRCETRLDAVEKTFSDLKSAVKAP